MSSLLKKVLLNSLQGASFCREECRIFSTEKRDLQNSVPSLLGDTSAVSLGPFYLNNLNFAETLLNVSY